MIQEIDRRKFLKIAGATAAAAAGAVLFPPLVRAAEIRKPAVESRLERVTVAVEEVTSLLADQERMKKMVEELDICDGEKLSKGLEMGLSILKSLERGEIEPLPRIRGLCPDFNCDGIVDVLDFSILASCYTSEAPPFLDVLGSSLEGNNFRPNYYHFLALASRYEEEISSEDWCSVAGFQTPGDPPFGAEDVRLIYIESQKSKEKQWARCDIAFMDPGTREMKRGHKGYVGKEDVLFALEVLSKKDSRAAAELMKELSIGNISGPLSIGKGVELQGPARAR